MQFKRRVDSSVYVVTLKSWDTLCTEESIDFEKKLLSGIAKRLIRPNAFDLPLHLSKNKSQGLTVPKEAEIQNLFSHPKNPETQRSRNGDDPRLSS